MIITKKTSITNDIARALNALPENEKQAAVDALTEKQALALFDLLLKL